MSAEQSLAVKALQAAFLDQHPTEATRMLEKLPGVQIAALLSQQPLSVSLKIWERLVPDIAMRALEPLSPKQRAELFTRVDPARTVTWLAGCSPELRAQYLAQLPEPLAAEQQSLLAFPANSAGSLMDPRVLVFRPSMTVKEGLQRLRSSGRRDVRSVFMADDEGRLLGSVTLQALALELPSTRLSALMQPVVAFVDSVASREEVVSKLQDDKLTDLPVVDIGGQLIGVVRPYALITAVENETSAKLQMMVGVSKDERALSSVAFSVSKRLPWLQINLLTAFLAASVVGLFEATIAQYTALAVLLPVVAGQSGNTGAQALAVTMRGLALREVRISHWPRLLLKEAYVGFFNGLAVALVTGLGVWLWSGSQALALVILVSMVISMVIASVSGALIPVILTKIGQDPAQSSSIFLTTVTDVAGFFSFLGIATLLVNQL
ncbi:MAG: magnesium transporter [Motiliproteus sp.]|jgi:magnesium transporter